MICERCGKETYGTTMSFFNRETICMECNDAEERHPDYERAHEIEVQEVLKGNYNYPGVGLPADLRPSNPLPKE